MTKEPVCQIEIDGVGDDKKVKIKVGKGKEINIKRKPAGGFDATDEHNERIEPVTIKLSAEVIDGNLPFKFPPDEFVMYSQSSPGCGYYYIGGRLVYK